MLDEVVEDPAVRLRVLVDPGVPPAAAPSAGAALPLRQPRAAGTWGAIGEGSVGAHCVGVVGGAEGEGISARGEEAGRDREPEQHCGH